MSHLGLHARRDHDRPASPVRHRGPAEDHVVAIAEAYLVSDDERVLGHRKALTGERALGGL